jgi:hypothetical protein
MVLKHINQSLFLDESKINKLWNNIILNFDKLEDNAMTIWIVWEWWSWKSSFLNILLGNITELKDEYFFEDKKIEIEDWLKIENKIKSIKLDKDLRIWWEKINTTELKVLSINSWLINNIISDPLFNLVQIINKELWLWMKDFEWSKFLWAWKAFMNKASNFLSKVEIWWAKIDLWNFETIYDDLLKMKDSFYDKLNKKLWENSKLILIVDDLDRIPPEEAVAILDSIKLFLDNSNILIFLLNDKDIVKRWLKWKLWLDNDEESKKIANSYLDKLINIEIDIKEYYNESKFKTDILWYIKENIFIKDIKWLGEKITNDVKIIDSLHQIENMRRIKKLFKNFQIQAPSIVDYKKWDDEDKLLKYFEYFNKILDKYSLVEKKLP